MAVARELTFPAEGTLARHPLPSLLGWLDRVRATGALDLRRRRLVRRFVLAQGRLELLVSNAREDRLYEWARESGRLELDAERRARIERVLAGRPLSGAALVDCGLAAPETVRAWLREQLLETLAECALWRDARYELHPGRLEPGAEPTASLPALAAALALARGMGRHRPALPRFLVRREGAALPEGVELPAAERALWDRLDGPLLADGLDAPEREAAEVLFAAGLLVESAPPRARGSAPHVGEDELREWLKAAASEQLERLLGIEPGSDVDAVRRAYYRTVRRFHPDRFRSGPLARYHAEVERAFRMVHEALQVLTDPAQYRAWQKRRREQARRDPERLARQRLALARAAARAGNRAEAVEHLERALEQHPENVEVSFHLALLLLGNPRRRPEALEQLERLAEENPHRADIVAALGLALRKTGATRRAAETLARALAVDRDALLARAARNDPEAMARVRENPFLAPLLA